MKFFTFAFLVLIYGQNSFATTVRLITIGPGDAFWSAFGHSAIAIDNDVYAFGYFSFDEDTFSSFINNNMLYDSGLSDLDREIFLAQQQNRDFSAIELNLNETEITQITDYLSWHTRPENQSYKYDYFLNNCSTKVRDILSMAWNPGFNSDAQFVEEESGQNSYFQQTFPAKHQGMMNFGLALGYGWSAYTDRNPWQLMALPVYFEQYVLANINISQQPLNRQLIYAAKSTSPIKGFLKTHWFLILYVFLWTLFLLFKSSQVFTAKAWFIWHGIIGLTLLFLWFLTPHLVADWNFNVLLFNPLGLLLLKYRKILPVLFLAVVMWLILALYLGAWYLMPLLLPAMLALKYLAVVNKLDLTFGDVVQ